jgi:hypothetical protein
MLHAAAGIGLGLLFGAQTGRLGRHAVQAGDGAMALFSAAILIGVL